MDKTEEIKNHIKESMCIDGDIHFVGTQELGTAIKDSKGNYQILHGVIFECNDSKRGQFFIGWYLPEPKPNIEE